MKSKKRHHNSSDESEDSDASVQSSSSSDSDSDDSSISEPRYKKKRKRANSSDSDSNSDDQKRSKKRKHKKKKKKHSKKKRRSDSLEDVTDDNISISEGEISVKKKRKHKHKHSKRSQSSGLEDEFERHSERRLMSVVKERRGSSEEGSQPSRTYYQKEYHSTVHPKEYDIEHDSQKYYKEASREHVYHDFNYRETNDRYQEDNRQREKYGHSSHNDEYGARPREYNDYKRSAKYESKPEEIYKRDDPYVPKEDMRGNPRYQRYDERPPKRFEDNRDYHDRRCPPEPDRYRDKEYDKRVRYNEERYSPESDITSDCNELNITQLQRNFNYFNLNDNCSRRL